MRRKNSHCKALLLSLLNNVPKLDQSVTFFRAIHLCFHNKRAQFAYYSTIELEFNSIYANISKCFFKCINMYDFSNYKSILRFFLQTKLSRPIEESSLRSSKLKKHFILLHLIKFSSNNNLKLYVF